MRKRRREDPEPELIDDQFDEWTDDSETEDTDSDTSDSEATAGGGGGGGGVGQTVRDPRDTITTAGFAAAAVVEAREGVVFDARSRTETGPTVELVTELVLAEMALAIIEDEHTRVLDGDELLAYDELETNDVAADLIDAHRREREQEHDFTRAEMNRLAWYVRGWQMLLDHDFDFAASGNALPDRTIALRGAISAAIARVGGLPARTVGGYVSALRQSRTTAAEPYITAWVRAGSVPPELRHVLPDPVDTPEWRRAAEAALILEATGELTGRRASTHLVLAVSHSLADLNDARRALGLGVVRLSAIERNAGRLTQRTQYQGHEFERGMEPGSYSPT